MSAPVASAAAFFDCVIEVHERALSAAGEVVHNVCFGDEHARLVFAGSVMADLLLPALDHLLEPCDRSTAPALTVRVFDSESTGVAMPPAPWRPAEIGAKGEVGGFNDERFRTVFSPGTDLLMVYDAERAEALCWAPSHRLVPWWEPTFPFRTILHWWSAGGPNQPVHAGAIAEGDAAVLVTGRSGSGKTTTTLACLEAGLDYLGDDYVLVDTADPTVWSLYDTAKLEPPDLVRFPGLAPLVHNPQALDTQKALLHLGRHRPEQLRLRAPLKAIVVPQVVGGVTSEIVPTSPSAALTALAPTTVFQLAGHGRETFAKLTRLVRSVPCYTLRAGEDLGGVAEAVRSLLGSLA